VPENQDFLKKSDIPNGRSGVALKIDAIAGRPIGRIAPTSTSVHLRTR